MKQATALILFIILLISASSPALAQKGRLTKGSQIEKQEAVVFATAEAVTDGNGVFITWQTERETKNVGFYVYRINGEKHQVGNMTLGSATRVGNETVFGESHSIFDPDGDINSLYIVESLRLDGKRSTSNRFIPTIVPDIAPFAGSSSKELIERQELAKGIVADDSLAISKELQTDIDEHQLLADPVVQRWVAAQPAAKIGVRQQGIYRITRAQLQSAGFDVNANSSLWQLYTDGIEQAFIVGPNADYIEFYGKGIDTPESDTRMYYLVVGTSTGKRISSVGIRPPSSTVRSTNYDQTAIIKQRTSYVSDVLNGDAENYWGNVITSSISTFNFNLTGVDLTAGTARVVVRIQGLPYTPPMPHTVNLVLNGQALPIATGSNGQSFSSETVLPVSALREGSNSLQMSATTSTDFSFFDSIQVSYKRSFLAVQNRLSFVTQNYRGAAVHGFSSSNVRVFDTTYDGQPQLLTGISVTPNGGTFDANLPAYRGRVLFAVEDSAISQPATLEPNIPSTLSIPAHNANLVIIAYKDFLAQAETWAQYRRGQGFSVEVINVDDIYDEFNYGALSANSMRDFLQYAKNNWQTPPQYVLLIGDGSYDPRNYQGTGYWDLVPAKIVNTVYLETASDDAIVDFNDDGLAEMAIGRIPARTTAMVTTALTKTMTFEQPAMQMLSRGAIFAYDSSPDYDFGGMSVRLRDQLPVGTPAVMISRADANAPTTLINEINNGRYIVNYAGHGATGSWQGIFFVSSVAQLTNQNDPTIFTMLTCLNGFFHNLTNESLAEKLLNHPTGGAASAWASSGTTTPDVQDVMGQRFYHQLALGNTTRMGDLIIDAKTAISGGRDVRLSWVLIGDPMLKVR